MSTPDEAAAFRAEWASRFVGPCGGRNESQARVEAQRSEVRALLDRVMSAVRFNSPEFRENCERALLDSISRSGPEGLARIEDYLLTLESGKARGSK